MQHILKYFALMLTSYEVGVEADLVSIAYKERVFKSLAKIYNLYFESIEGVKTITYEELLRQFKSKIAKYDFPEEKHLSKDNFKPEGFMVHKVDSTVFTVKQSTFNKWFKSKNDAYNFIVKSAEIGYFEGQTMGITPTSLDKASQNIRWKNGDRGRCFVFEFHKNLMFM